MLPRQNPRAFTRIELLALCSTLGLIAIAVLPALASNKTDSERFICFNNLRMIGRAVQMWAGDHNQQPPWRTRTDEGGLMPLPTSVVRPGNAWFDFAYMSNELTTPKILACPSDADTKLATEFSTRTNGGLMEPGFRFRSVSYGIGLESVADSPRAWMSGDRNLGAVRGGSGCSSRVNNVTFYPTTSAPLAWTNGVAHGESGHILLSDGSVEFTSTSRLRELLLFPPADDNGLVHFIRAR